MRPTKLTPKVVEQIEKAAGLGLPYDKVARAVGIHPSTLYRWRARGLKAKRGIFRELCDGIEIAEAERGLKYLEAIDRSIFEERVVTKERVRKLPDGSTIREVTKEYHPPNVKAAQWWIERRIPGFGRKDERDDLAPKEFKIVIVDPNPDSDESVRDQTGNMALPAAGGLNETPEQSR